MAPKQHAQSPKGKPTSSVDQSLGTESMSPSSIPPALGHEPGISHTAVDVTGIVPEGVRIDPDLTEGHPGYEESGGSGIIPAERPSGEKPARKKTKRGARGKSPKTD